MAADHDLFAGLDAVRWSRMRHAYGSARDVPDLLRGLADPDPAVREQALDDMYGAVHHQGDVYPCTVAAIPFLLRIVERPGLPGRAEVVELVASIGSAADPTGLSGPYRKADEAVAAASPLWARLLDDEDPRVREATAGVLLAGADEAVLARLAGRLAVEDDHGVRAAIVRAAGVLARRPEHAADTRAWLARTLEEERDPRLRLGLLAELAALPDTRLDLPVAEVLDLINAAYEGRRPTAPAAGAAPSAGAAPAADALFEGLSATAEREARHAALDGGAMPWVVVWDRGLPSAGPALHALGGTGDERALPMLAWALDREQMPHDAGSLVIGYGPRAAPLVPILRRRLRDLPTGDPHDHRRGGVAHALARIGPAAAEALPDLLAQPVTPAVVTALAALDPAARDHLPVLREAASSPDRALAVPAARALWEATGGAGAALAVADRCLDGDAYSRRDAADLLADLGPAAHARAGRLRRLARSVDPYGWLTLSAVRALWRVTGDPGTALPVSLALWEPHPYRRTALASLWTEIGPAAAEARPLLLAELGRARRHNAADDGYSTGHVRDDEKLLTLCRAALAAIADEVHAKLSDPSRRSAVHSDT
ncbi:hypothetical protein [Nonomuraea sp. SYSU D8015]|uniref:hypothetical protein n=1 Tax=Nonomuraea sp. SYSU D8015 TaxID=2593644 RepID=UPI001660EEF7|nr:hypothetical protein [Nonomuraea sp. SYSU D8015]